MKFCLEITTACPPASSTPSSPRRRTQSAATPSAPSRWRNGFSCARTFGRSVPYIARSTVLTVTQTGRKDIETYSSTVLQLFCCKVVYLYSCTLVQSYICTVVHSYNRIFVQLYTVQFYRFSAVQTYRLYSCTVV